MSVARRGFQRDSNDLSKRLKRPFRLVADMMPEGFTDDEYVDTFMECFPGLWQAVVEFKKEHDLLDKERQRLHKTGVQYHFPEPLAFVLSKSKAVRKNKRNQHNQGVIHSEQERIALHDKYLKRAIKKESEKAERRQAIGEMQQEVTPPHANYFIDTYFAVKHKTPEDVHTRMRILEEAAKFTCEETEIFMRKVNSTERNYHLRNFAFKTLQQQFGHTAVHLHSNRNGKMHPGDDIEPRKMDTPELLMQEIYQSEYNLEANKVFDVFLSHSSKDYERIIQIKAMLNRQGLTIYVDWIEDRNALKRELTSTDTAKALTERIKQSRAILYVLTSTSIASVWTPWELGFAQALRKKICVLQLEEMVKAPEYLDLYEKTELNDNRLFAIQRDGTRLPLEAWLNN